MTLRRLIVLWIINSFCFVVGAFMIYRAGSVGGWWWHAVGIIDLGVAFHSSFALGRTWQIRESHRIREQVEAEYREGLH